MSRLLEWGLRVWAGLLVTGAVLWVLGPYGAGMVFGGQLMRWPLRHLLHDGPLEGLLTGPVFGADLRDESAYQALSDLGQRLTDDAGGPVTGSRGDINLGWSVQFSTLTPAQQAVFVALHVLPLVAMAALWWSLASVVRQSRSESVFTRANALRLTVAGAVIAAGAPLLALATWGLHRWVVDTSQLDGRVDVAAFGIEHVPWTAVAAGLALLVLGSVWRRGVSLQHDVAGLV